MTKEEIMQAIENMTVLELSELVKAMEDKFGVSAAAPVCCLLLLALLLVLLLKRRPSSRLSSQLLATRRSTSSRLSVKLRVSA